MVHVSPQLGQLTTSSSIIVSSVSLPHSLTRFCSRFFCAQGLRSASLPGVQGHVEAREAARHMLRHPVHRARGYRQFAAPT